MTYVAAGLLSYLVITIMGIYVWITGFRLKQVEYFFYVCFVVVMYSLIHFIIMTFIIPTALYVAIASIIFNGFLDFYVLSVHYSFLVDIETTYRRQRKQYTENRLQEEKLNKTSSSINLNKTTSR